ncbi:MAG TPA: MopE-related protein, partial [Myxococcota bacterium]|nr:MopE-related protein [Myxococcota bacterium]
MRRWWGIASIVGLAACADADGDGVSSARDCDDGNPRVFDGAVEVCNGRDDDCDGQIDEDVAMVAWQDRDGDGFGDPARSRRVCKMPEDGVTNSDDCDDLDAARGPGMPETCDGRDDDCDGQIDEEVATTYYLDADGDGYGVASSTIGGCVVPEGYARVEGDCDDAEPLAWSGAVELCDGVDNDCDGGVDEGLDVRPWPVDADGDGHGDAEATRVACGPLDGLSADALDCDDADLGHGPDTPEDDDNGLDDDCDGWTDEIEVPTLYATVAEALLHAGAGDVVQIVTGLHEEDVQLPARPAITLAGEGCGRSVLVGSGAGSVVSAAGGVIDGLTITGGSAGGLRVNGEVTARDICVSDNFNLEFGGGVLVETGHLDLSDAWITGNGAALDGGGIAVMLDATLDARRVHVIGNSALAGGGLNARSAVVRMSASVFAGNLTAGDGGAVAVRRVIDVPESPGADLTFTNCTFDGHGNLNDADGDQTAFGAAIYLRNSECPVGSSTCFQSRLTVRNTLFTWQWAVDEPVVYANNTDRTLEHNGFFGNAGRDDRYAWEIDAVRGDPDYVLRDDAVPPTAWDLRLQPGSAYIDAGDPAILDPDGSRSDIGAYGGPDAPASFDDGYRRDDDGDGLLDLWEAVYGLHPWEDDAALDPDGDGLDNAGEASWRTDPRVPDSDGDGVLDGREVAERGDPGLASDHAAYAAIDVRR